MQLVIGIAIGFVIRHVLWYPEKRQRLAALWSAAVQLFKSKTNENNPNQS